MTERTHHSPVFALLAVQESTPLALHGLYEVFHSVGHTWEELTGEPSKGGAIEPIIVAASTRRIATGVGIPIQPQAPLGEADVVIVPDLAISPTADPAGKWPVETAWLRDRYEAGAVICSVCTGAVMVAEAGLLDGLQATSHWAAAELIRRHYPNVRLAPERILCADGDGDRIVTSGGASSWQELALYLVARFCGGDEAVRIAKIFLFGDRTDGQLPYAGARIAHDHTDAVVAEVQLWIADNYGQENPVASMIAVSGLSDRTFARRFRTATGYSPIDYVQTLRLEEAKHLLETTDQPTDAIADEVGYADPAYFQRLFRRKVGITPATYRRRFSTIARATIR